MFGCWIGLEILLSSCLATTNYKGYCLEFRNWNYEMWMVFHSLQLLVARHYLLSFLFNVLLQIRSWSAKVIRGQYEKNWFSLWPYLFTELYMNNDSHFYHVKMINFCILGKFGVTWMRHWWHFDILKLELICGVGNFNFFLKRNNFVCIE